MIELALHNDISKEGGINLFFGDGYETFGLATVKRALAESPEDPDLTINIHCDGGSVSEGLAIYDFLRASGKNIYCNIEGSCHSMAIVILLAAPLENRTANMHSTALIHRVRCCNYSAITAADAMMIAKEIEAEEDRIATIYSERIGKNKAACLALMKAERARSATELLELGFISKINMYNTNKKQNKMSNSKLSIGQKIDKFLNSAASLLGETKNYDFKDAEGKVLFSTETEEDTLAVGDTVKLAEGETGGTFELPDGRKVVVVDGVVTEIAEADPEPQEDPEKEALKAELANARELIIELQNKIGSTFTPPARTNKVDKSKEPAKGVDLEEMKKKRAQFKNYGKGGTK